MEKATATHVHLNPDTTPGFTHAPILTSEGAKLASELLTINHASYHSRWKGTFHNHLVHHLLAQWALGASPDPIRDLWEFNKPYQSSIRREDSPIEEPVIWKDLKDPKVFEECLAKDECYADFLKFFEDEITEKGVPETIKEYFLKGDARADDIFSRMFADLVHPMIHLGCGLEFHQPAIAAEALAGACIHSNWPIKFFLPTEDHVRSKSSAGKDIPSKPLLQILGDMRNDPVIKNGCKATDPFNKIPDGFLKRVSAEQLAPYLGQFQVKPTPEDIQYKLSEFLYTVAYMAGAAQKPGKYEAMDFVLLHSVTLSVFYPALMALDWISNVEKARLLEAAARMSAVMYGGCGCPELYPERVVNYTPRKPEHGWSELFHRANIYRDEGHLAKAMRAFYALDFLPDASPLSSLPIKKEDLIKIAHMALDSAERAFEPDGTLLPDIVADGIAKSVGFGGEMVADNLRRFVFYGGLDDAWKYIPDLDRKMAVNEPMFFIYN
ncbi:hypothetical protein GQ43DRAFT_438277 [Delitschia confertaspora ATCC 74209]|uniref:Oxidoreductase AflY n=1 Tax=Delitschia confertaspora ATCC 74209 TaxID=1513339 RepID=A0A9P4JQX7_9PLEO|nr:hypothetical protein GQ43DRAFT_438277 [Delitschia confertaspora ATCC 74209]